MQEHLSLMCSDTSTQGVNNSTPVSIDDITTVLTHLSHPSYEPPHLSQQLYLLQDTPYKLTTSSTIGVRCPTCHYLQA